MLPKLVLIKQTNPAPPPIQHAYEVAIAQMRALDLTDSRKLAGKRIGIAVGSRGINRIPELAKAVSSYIKEKGGYPVVFPAMGSHGGGTSAGQREVLASLGITEGAVGAPVECCADCQVLGKTKTGLEVHCNQIVHSFDGIVLINRVKPHTDFSDRTESGLLKMLAIGIGNPTGCNYVHSTALTHGYGPTIRAVAALMLEKLPVVFGLMVTENWQSKLDSITAVLPQDFLDQEVARLQYVKEHMVKLPVRELDALIVAEIGKDISGTGMDTKVIGRIMVKGQTEPEYPKIGRIAVLSVTEASHGNAIGIGLADFTTQQVLDHIDIPATTLNAVSSMCPEQGRIPCVVATEEDAVHASICTLGMPEELHKDAKVIYIQNTNSLETIAVSTALYELIKDSGNIELLSEPEDMCFSASGTFVTFREQFRPTLQS